MRNKITRIIQIGNKKYDIESDDTYLTSIGDNFEPHMCDLFDRLIESDFEILDIGANIGLTSILFGNIGKHVNSFEPSPSTFEYLSKNIINSKLNNISIHNIGLGNFDEQQELTFSESNRAGAYVSNITKANHDHTVEIINIKKGDNFLKDLKKNIDFIKIDVEGFEMNVIKGLSNVIKVNTPIIVLELNHYCLNALQRISLPDFFDFLLSIFPKLYAVDHARYLNLHDTNARFTVMYEHINFLRFPNIVAAFCDNQLQNLKYV